MDERLDSIAELLRNKQKELDDIEWDNPQDPRIEALVREILEYKEKFNKGEIYDPRF
jgi:hypothetical protein